MMGKLTLSSRIIATLLGESPFETAWSQFVSKVTGKNNFSMNYAMEHGNKYESEAVEMYKLVTKNEVETPKNIFKHDKYDFITGAIDGIVNDNIILEIKCPYRNQYPEMNESFEICKFYWCQVQIYMEILDKDETHFVEYYRKLDNNISFRWKIIKRDKEWFAMILPKAIKFYDEIKLYREIGIEKHPVQAAIDNWNDK